MRVAKWGNSLAVRLPASVVDALQRKEGDEIEIYVADAREFGVSRKPTREDLLRAFEPFAGGFPPISNSTAARRTPGSFLDINVLLDVA